MRAAYVKREVPRSRCGTASSSSPPSTAEGSTRRRAIRSCCSERRIASRRTASTGIPRALGPSDLFQKDGFIFVYQDVRGRYMSEGEWVEMRPHCAVEARPGRHRREHRHLRHDRVAGEEHPQQQRPRRHVGHFVSGLLRRRRHCRRASGAEGGVAAGADRRPVHGRRCVSQRRVHAGGELRLLRRLPSARRAGRRRATTARRFDYGTPDGYDYFLRLGALANSTRAIYGADNPYWDAMIDHPTYDEFWKTRSILPHLKAITPAILTVGGWFDAEDLAGPLGHLSRDRAEQSRARRTRSSWARGRTAAGRAATASGSGNLEWGSEDRRLLPREDRVSLLRAPPEGSTDARALPEATVFVTGRNEWRRHETWPPREAHAPHVLLPACRRRGSTTDAPSERGEAAFDEYVSDPEPAGALRRLHGDGHAARLHDRGPAIRGDAARRARLRDRAARRRRHGRGAGRRSRCTCRRPGPTPTG